MSDAVELTKTQTPSLREVADKAIANALRSMRPDYAYFGQSPHVRLNKAIVGRPGVTMKFQWTKHRSHPGRKLALTEIALDIRTERKLLLGTRVAQSDFYRTFAEPLDLSETCMDALTDLETRDEQETDTEAKRLDDAALGKLVAALSTLAD